MIIKPDEQPLLPSVEEVAQAKKPRADKGTARPKPSPPPALSADEQS